MEQNYYGMQVNYPVYPQMKPLKNDVQIGSLPINVMITVNTYVPGVVIIITWAISTYMGDTVPWPVMITDTASFYPQNILFRIGLLVPLFYWGVLCLLVKWWIRSGVQSSYGLGNSKPLNLQIVGYLSVICYGITISTIDQGQTATHLHGACAVIFLILQMVYQVGTTIVLKQIREVNPQFISRWSLDRKLLICYVWIIPIIALIYEAINDNKYGIALAEWVAVYQVIFYNHSFNDDLKHFKLAIDDEGFKLSQLRQQIGYAPEYCIDKNEQEEEEKKERTEEHQQNSRPIVHPNYPIHFHQNNFALHNNGVNNHCRRAQFNGLNQHIVQSDVEPVYGVPAYQVEKNTEKIVVQTEMKNFQIEPQQQLNQAENPLPQVSPSGKRFKQTDQPHNPSAAAPGFYYMNPVTGELIPMNNGSA